MGIIYALIASFLQGIGYTFLKRSFTELPSSLSFMFEAILGILVWVPYSLFVGVDFSEIFIVFIYALISALLSEAFVFYALSKGDVSITGSVFSTYPVFTILFSRIINNEILDAGLLLFICATIVGVVILSLPKKLAREDLIKNTYILWPLVGALAVGVSDTLTKGALSSTDSSTFLFCLAFAQIPISIGYLLFEKQTKAIPSVIRDLKKHRYLLGASIALSTSMIFFWLAFESTLASIASPITSIQMLFVLIFSRIFMKETLRPIEVGGILLIIASVAGVAIWF